MQLLQQLQDASFQAFLNFKSNATNVAQVNAAYAKIVAAAEASANMGLYTVSINLVDLGVQLNENTSQPLFQRYLSELLTDQGLLVDFFADGQQSWVLIDWNPEDVNQ